MNLSEDEFELFEHAQYEYSLINSKKFADRKHWVYNTGMYTEPIPVKKHGSLINYRTLTSKKLSLSYPHNSLHAYPVRNLQYIKCCMLYQAVNWDNTVIKLRWETSHMFEIFTILFFECLKGKMMQLEFSQKGRIELISENRYFQ